jgi:hypothetical protein
MSDINKDQMAKSLVSQASVIRKEMMELERRFNEKKEIFLKIQGSLETLALLGTEIPPMEDTSTEASEQAEE